ncbi:SusC/RagA family TonB-linked outer membrane protein [Marivirga lumbricoides]
MRQNVLLKIKLWMMLIPLLCIQKQLNAQNQSQVVQGKVTSLGDNTSLPGVSVLLKGTNTGTVTGIDGEFTLEVPSGESVLVFSFVGFSTEEIVVGNRQTINVTLSEDITTLGEVVVIGYQTVRKEDLTGAVAVITPEASKRVSANSLAESIQGLAPGVTVRNGGGPGEGASIDIRGVASFTNTNPLYVIDGMIADANPTINTNDIASIQILKDASAAAIYGSRAANGVIIITTKQGKEGPAKISASAKYGVQQIANRWDLMNSAEFAAMQRRQYENSGETIPSSVTDVNPEIDTDWQDEVIRTGNIQDYNVTLSGGSETSSYLVSGSYFKNEGAIIGQSFDRSSLRVNTKSKVGRITFGENLLLSNSFDRSPGDGNPFYDMPQMLPVIPVQSDDYISATNPEGWGIGSIDAVTYAWNSVAVNSIDSRRANFAKLVGNAYVDVEFTDWLYYKFNAGVEVSFDHVKNVHEYGVWRFNAPDYPSTINEERSRYSSLLFEHTLNFKKELGAHSINGVLGYSQQSSTREFTSAGRSNLMVYNGRYYKTIGSATGDAVADGGIPVDYSIYGYLGRVNYVYNDKYLLTLTARLDEDSRFGANYRQGFFPSVAAGWRISEESFFNLDKVSDLKLKASYGELGINPVGSWDYTAFINTNPRAIFGPNEDVNVGSTQARLANPDLKWEERVVKNIGIEAGLFRNSLLISVEAYDALSKDNLLQLPVGGYLGNLGGNPFVNAGSIRNRGIEAAVTYRSYGSDLKWDASFNITTIKNTVEDVGNRGEGIDYIQIGNTRTQVGRSIGEWYVLETDGLFQSEDEVLNYTNSEGTVIQPFAKPGDVKYVDHNDDGTINVEDRTFAGSPWPTLQTGAQFNVSYKQFSLNAQFVGVFGTVIYNDVRKVLDSYQRTNFRADINPWTPENTNTSDPRIGLDTEQGIIDNNLGNTDRWLENGSYVRLRNLELGYALPEIFMDRTGLESGRLFISAQNLFTITPYSGLDPDVTGNGIYERGLDNGNWPSSRVFSLGVQLEF